MQVTLSAALLLTLDSLTRVLAQDIHPDARYAEAVILQQQANGFRGIWYMNQPSNDEYVYKYSGGLATYPANHRPFAIYAKAVNKTFFCFGGTNEANSTLHHNVSYFDHKTGKVANPIILLDKNTTDAHDNPVISLDDQGYVWIFSTSHGVTRPSYIHRSKQPYDISAFETIQATERVDGQQKPFANFSYFQVYHLPGKGFLALFTKYNQWSNRVIGYNTSSDGVHWNEWRVLANIGQGHYQISAEKDGKIGVAFDVHPQGKGLNYRTNLHYLQTTDFGKSWHTAGGQPVQLPLTEINNPALIKDFMSEKLNCYLLDMEFDEEGNPNILIISSKGFEAGPANHPRRWRLFQHRNRTWENHLITTSDSNYDMGSVFPEPNGVIKVIGPTLDGPQVYNPGGEVALWTSRDGGKHWELEKQITRGSERNHSYVRRPRGAHPDFYGIWADGHGRRPSESYLYFMNKKGELYQLPRQATEPMITPRRVKQDKTK